MTRPRHRPARAALVGVVEEPLAAVLGEVLNGLDVHLTPIAPFELVLAVVSSNDVEDVLGAARALARGGPVIAILPLRDERAARRALAAGASACHALDQSTAELASAILGMMGRADRSGAGAS